MAEISPDRAELFNKEYTESLYREYLDVKYEDDTDIENLKKAISGKKVAIIAPGKSISSVEADIIKLKDEGTILVSVNFVPSFCMPDYVFYTNIKRLESENSSIRKESKIILTSNLFRYDKPYDFAIEFAKLAHHDDLYSEDSTLMMIHLLTILGLKDLSVAGFDGFISAIFDV